MPPPLDEAHHEVEVATESSGSSPHSCVSPKGMDDDPDEPQKEHRHLLSL
jgi:hypothetical protein